MRKKPKYKKKENGIYIVKNIEFRKDEIDYLHELKKNTGIKQDTEFIRFWLLKDRDKWEKEQSGFRKWLSEKPGVEGD